MSRSSQFGAPQALLIAVCLVVLGVAISACGGGGSSSSSEESSSTTSEESSSTTSEESDKPVTIAFFVGYTSIPFYVQAGEGAEAAGAEDGNAKVVADGPTEPTTSQITVAAENLLQSSQPDGYVTDPCSTTAWAPLFPRLVAEVPNGNVLAADCQATNTPEEETPEGATTFVGNSYTGQGRELVKASIESAKLPPSTTGTVLLGECIPGIPVLERQITGAKEELAKLLPKAQVQVISTGPSQSENTAAWTSAVNKYTDVVFAMGACDADTASLLVLKERHIGGEFVAGAHSAGTPSVVQGIKNGYFAAGLNGLPWVVGNVSTRLSIAAARGTPLPEGWINTGVGVITKANADEYLASFKSPQAQEKMFKPMADKIMENLSPKPIADSF
jgi:ABC-type sugar transport system substrate-binding protein